MSKVNVNLPDSALGLLSSFNVIFGIVATLILLIQRCQYQNYGLYVSGLIAYFISYELVRYFLY